MRFLARFASAADLECFRLDELRAVCGLLGIRNWFIEGLASTGDHFDQAPSRCGSDSDVTEKKTLSSPRLIGFNNEDDPALFVDALIVDETAAANAKAKLIKINKDQPLGNYKNFYCTDNQQSTAASSGETDTEGNRHQPLNFAIIHFDTIRDAVEVAKRCVLLKGLNLLLGTATTIEGMLEEMHARIEEERTFLAAQEGDGMLINVPENSFVNPSVTLIGGSGGGSEKGKKKETGAQQQQQQQQSGKSLDEKRVDVLVRQRSSEAKTLTEAEALLLPLLNERYNFKYHVEGVCYTVSGPRKLEIIQQFAAIPHAGSVSLADPHLVFEVTLLYQHIHVDPRQLDRAMPPLLGVAYSVPIALSSRTYILDRYALNKRPYIGTTSMPPELTFLMANLAKVKGGDVCYDPFCGTCSSLITCAHHGAIAYGSDIDGLAMRGGSAKFRASKQVLQQQKLAMKNYLPHCLAENGGPVSKSEADQPTVLTNFKVYGLQPPERLRYDFSLWVTLFDQLDGAYTKTLSTANGDTQEQTSSSSSPSSLGVKRPRGDHPFLFDAILSDPPYGIREQKLQTTGAAEEEKKKKESGGGDEDEGDKATAGKKASAQPQHTPANVTREDYDISNMIVDLIRFAGVHLDVGKRLVFWHPTTYHYTHDELPRHPYLKIVLARPQMLSLKLVRVLVVMEKVEEPWYPLPAGVSGPRDVTREVLFPCQKTASLRQLMDTTELDDNKAYDQYKTRRENKREAVRAFWRQQNINSADVDADAGEGTSAASRAHQTMCTHTAEASLSRRQLSKQKALLNLENREKKLSGDV